jgi:hypothetical protein
MIDHQPLSYQNKFITAFLYYVVGKCLMKMSGSQQLPSSQQIVWGGGRAGREQAQAACQIN